MIKYYRFYYLIRIITGNCTSPDVCECAPGWIGFDCRTPVCDNSYYYHSKQKSFVSGLETKTELKIFESYLGNNTHRLTWPYSNQNYSYEREYYVNGSYILRYNSVQLGKRYLSESNWTLGYHIDNYQGGYRCSIRSVTKWENISYLFESPNYYSHYMDKHLQHDGNYYTYWNNFSWPGTYEKSRILDQLVDNITYAYTNEGYRRFGIWNRTANNWEYGVCLLEFQRNCSTDTSKELDLESDLYNVLVQDTDLSYRPRILYNDYKVEAKGRWNEAGSQCIDNVVRGCYNNGTCVAPNTCRCSTGWTGASTGCNIPICEQTCQHHGNCTLPNICTCEKGWEGIDCR